MLNSLAILAWLKTIMRNELAAARAEAPFADGAKGMKMALRSRMGAVILGMRFFCTSYL